MTEASSQVGMSALDPSDVSRGDVLLIAPHPDDEALGCGGTVRLLTAAGVRVVVVVMARGDGGVDGQTSAQGRQDESRRACEALGAEPPLFAELPSPELRASPQAAAQKLASLLEGQCFAAVLVPGPMERHDTHRASLLAALLAPIAEAGAAWYGYGVWDALPAVADVVEVDITAARVAKTRAVTAHESQVGARPLAAGVMSRDLSQAVYSRITGDETRKAVERLLRLDGLLKRLPPEAGERDQESVTREVVAWLDERQAVWTRSLWLD